MIGPNPRRRRTHPVIVVNGVATLLTIAVVGHNEAATLDDALSAAMKSARPFDRVVFIDSDSTDNSASIATSLGVDVVDAPLGKGAAMRSFLRVAPSDWCVFLDADIHALSSGFVESLVDAVDDYPAADMVIGDFDDWVAGGVLSNTWAIYKPLVRKLFPDVAGGFGSKPLTGFRAVRSSKIRRLDAMPDDFGVEAFLNIEIGLAGRVRSVKVGRYKGRFKYKPTMGREIGRAVLDSAVYHDRLSPGMRPHWDEWVEEVVQVVAGYHGGAEERSEFLARLRAVAARPLPSTQ